MRYKLYFIASMVIFGTIALFVRNIPTSASEIALFRGILGSIFLLLILLSSKRRISWREVYNNRWLLFLSGIALAFNWIFLFQAYRHTTISNAVLSYYFAPVFVMILSPLILKEKLSVKKLTCILLSVVGMFFLVASQNTAKGEYNHLQGILYGLIAAGFYATLILLNRCMKQMKGLETTWIQLTVASIFLLPYVLLTEELGFISLGATSLVNMIILGILHTGIGFYLFFTGMQKLKGQTVAALSYIDPVTSLMVSILLLKEQIGILQIVGGTILLVSTFISERKD
jgi:drug/metabolite transporter (DMT)-like permease